MSDPNTLSTMRCASPQFCVHIDGIPFVHAITEARTLGWEVRLYENSPRTVTIGGGFDATTLCGMRIGYYGQSAELYEDDSARCPACVAAGAES